MERHNIGNDKIIITYKKDRTVIDFDNDELAEFRRKCSKAINALDGALEYNGDMYMSEFFALKSFVDDIKWNFNFRRPKDNEYHGPLIAGNDPKAHYHDGANRPKKVNVGRPKKVATDE